MQAAGKFDADTSPIDRGVRRARALLPDQGPIGVFVHHNTLHALQHLPFHTAVQEGAQLMGTRAYLSLEEFRRHHETGRIDADDLRAALAAALGDGATTLVALGVTRQDLWWTLLRRDIDVDDLAGLAFLRQHGPPAEDDEILRAAETRLARHPRPARPSAPPFRHRDALVALGAGDTDVDVHAELIRLSAVFLDHGQALQAMPERSRGFLGAVAYLFEAGGPEPTTCPGVRADICGAVRAGTSAQAMIEAALQALGVDEDSMETFVLRTALALPGWAGMFSRLERHPHEHGGDGTVSLLDFLAVRLAHERRAIEARARAAGLPVAWPALRAVAGSPRPSPLPLDAWLLAGLARDAGRGADDVVALSDAALDTLWQEVAACSRLARQQVWQEAFEGQYRRHFLDGLAQLRALSSAVLPEAAPSAARRAARPDAQFLFCIDEREESLRRAIDEQPGHHDTFGVAGFFGLAIDYQGLDDAAPAAYCPVVVTPQHEVHESPVYTERGWQAVRAGLRQRWQATGRGLHRRSRTLSGGAGLSLLIGPLAGLTAMARVLAPRWSLAWRDRVQQRLVPRPATRLTGLQRGDDSSPASARGKQVGFSLDEAADRVYAVLQSIGLVHDMARVIVVVGHGSTSLNNPHESAHDCGACGGRRGGANARLFAEMANRLEVRAAVRARGIDIPADTWFVGALHDTADDSIRYADLEHLPGTHAAAFDAASALLERARGVSAAERTRRFDDAPLHLSPTQALQHVQARAAHMAQPRPEYGHCTNASCVVGRRALTRGLHLDRRAFLVSYDPTVDRDDRILERILAAVGPVGAGISLEYFFSSVDNERYGCGTKLPHNVTGLIGVMAGHQSDLRTGLPLQMVELHEPMRLLLVVEATPEALLAVASRQPEVCELVVKEWVQLVSVHPQTGDMMRFAGGGFVPYVPSAAPIVRVQHSIDWHGRTREPVPPALVLAALPTSLVAPSMPSDVTPATVA